MVEEIIEFSEEELQLMLEPRQECDYSLWHSSSITHLMPPEMFHWTKIHRGLLSLLSGGCSLKRIAPTRHDGTTHWALWGPHDLTLEGIHHVLSIIQGKYKLPNEDSPALKKAMETSKDVSAVAN